MAYSLGEAIGLQGRFDIAEKTAGAGIAATNARIKEAQKRAQEDEAAYERVKKNLRIDSDKLHPLFMNPATALSTDATAKLAEARAADDRTAMYQIENDFLNDLSELQWRSARWKEWDKQYTAPGTYQRKDQRDIRTLATGSSDYMQFAERAKAMGLTGYDFENHSFDPTGRLTTFSSAIDTTKVLNDRMRQIRLTEGKPVTAGDITTQMKYVFLTEAEANQFAKAEGLTNVPVSIESEVKNLLLNDPTFFNQYSDEQNTTDINALFKTAFADASKFAQKQIDESKDSGFKVAIYNAAQTPTPVTPNIGVNLVSSKKNMYPQFGGSVIPVSTKIKISAKTNTVDSAGNRVKTDISDGTPEEVVIMPYKLVKGTDNITYEKPLTKLQNTTENTGIDIANAFGFQAYVKISTTTETYYVPAEDYSDITYLQGSERYSSTVKDWIDAYMTQAGKVNSYFVKNKSNANNELFKLYTAYLQNPAANKDKLDAFLRNIPN
jgi:hypothetical protein